MTVTPSVTPAVTSTALVEDYFKARVTAGDAPGAVSATRAAKWVRAAGAPCSRQLASKVLGRLRAGER